MRDTYLQSMYNWTVLNTSRPPLPHAFYDNNNMNQGVGTIWQERNTFGVCDDRLGIWCESACGTPSDIGNVQEGVGQ